MSKGYEPVLLYHLKKQTDDAGNVLKTVKIFPHEAQLHNELNPLEPFELAKV